MGDLKYLPKGNISKWQVEDRILKSPHSFLRSSPSTLWDDALLLFYKNHHSSLTGVAQWIEYQKSLQFNSQSGPMPVLQARSPVGGT